MAVSLFLFFWFRLNEKRIHSLYVFVFHCCNNKLPETSQVIISHVWGSEARGLGCHSAPVSGCKDRASQPGSGRSLPQGHSAGCPRTRGLALGRHRSLSLLAPHVSGICVHLFLHFTCCSRGLSTHTPKKECAGTGLTVGRGGGRVRGLACLVREPLWSLGFWKEGH